MYNGNLNYDQALRTFELTKDLDRYSGLYADRYSDLYKRQLNASRFGLNSSLYNSSLADYPLNYSNYRNWTLKDYDLKGLGSEFYNRYYPPHLIDPKYRENLVYL